MDSYSPFFMFGFSLRFIFCINRSAPTIQSQTSPIRSYFLVTFSGNNDQITTKTKEPSRKRKRLTRTNLVFMRVFLVRVNGLEPLTSCV